MPLAVDSLERQLHSYKGLVEVSALINGITESDALLPAILDVARRVFQAEATSLFLLNSAGGLDLHSARGGGFAEAAVTPPITVPRGRGIAGWVLEHGEPQLVRDAYLDARFFREADRITGYRTRSILCAPLIRGEKKIGVIQVLNPEDRLEFDEEDLEIFVAYGNLVATAIEKLRTIDRQKEQQRIAQEAAFAQEIQTSFLPQTLPQRPDLHFAAAYRPAQNVGGDFYDVLETTPDELYFVIGDVSGKGVPAALLMAQAMSTLRLIIVPGISPEVALARWNTMLCGHTVRGMFITAALGRVVVSERRVELVSAGHCAPLRVTTSGAVESVRLPGAPPLGILPELPHHQQTLILSCDEWITFYTDGLSESFDPDDELLDHAGVAALLHHSFITPQEIVEALSAGEARHRQGGLPHDDLTLLVFGFR